MLTNIFNNTRPSNLIAIYGLSLGYILLYNGIIFPKQNNLQFLLTSVIIALLTWINLFIIEQICKRNNLCDNNRYIILYSILLMACFPNIFTDIYSLLSSVLILIALYKLVMLRNNSDEKRQLFDISLLVGVASICYDWSILFIIPIWVTCLSHTTQRYRNLFIPIIALFLIAMLIFGVVYPLTDWNTIMNLFVFQIKFSIEKYYDLRYLIPVIIIFTFSICLVFFFMFEKTKRRIIYPTTLVISLFIQLFILFISEEIGTSEMMFLNAPMALLMAIYTEKISKFWIRETILWVFFTLPILVFYLYYTIK
ncbi:DUF6427 family protein [Capnocytophaga catalasegens]|nr:DUF6427 family protein [Capnocytophaga catalasegens]